jgi:hypothetical protein
MKPKLVLLILLLIFLAYCITNRIFKVNYSGDNVAMIDSIRLNGSIINNAYIVLGKNYKGNIEATIIPAKEQRYKNEGIVEYPLVSEGLLFTRISLLGVADKITMFTNSNNN